MEVILLEKIHRLGELGDKVRVRSGYGRNYLIPQHKAVPATPENVEKFEQQRAELEAAQAEALGAAQKRAEAMVDLEVSIAARAGTEGKLFGSVGTSDIADAVTSAGVELEKREVRLPNGPLREVGEYDIEIHLHADLDTTIKVIVRPEDTLPAA